MAQDAKAKSVPVEETPDDDRQEYMDYVFRKFGYCFTGASDRKRIIFYLSCGGEEAKVRRPPSRTYSTDFFFYQDTMDLPEIMLDIAGPFASRITCDPARCVTCIPVL